MAICYFGCLANDVRLEENEDGCSIKKIRATQKSIEVWKKKINGRHSLIQANVWIPQLQLLYK